LHELVNLIVLLPLKL